MKKRRDFFDAFRESGQHLQITPSRSSWRKLERKLEAQKRRRRIQMYGIAGIAAILGLMLALAAIMPLLNKKQETPFSVGENPAPKSLEMLLPVSKTDTAALPSLEFSTPKRREVRAVEEGSRGKKLEVTGKEKPGPSK